MGPGRLTWGERISGVQPLETWTYHGWDASSSHWGGELGLCLWREITVPWKWKKMEKMRTTNSHTNGAGSDLTAEHRKEGRDPEDGVSLLESRCWTHSFGP